MTRPVDDRPLYTPLGFAMVRAPLLPVEAYSSLCTGRDRFELLADPRVRRAIAVGSLSLLNALDRFEGASLGTKEAEKLAAKLLRYEIRMSTRPTPYGLFAGCAMLPLGETTDVTIRSTLGRSCTRPDMAWLMGIVSAAEADPGIRRRLRLARNPLIRFEADRITLAAKAPGGRDGAGAPVSARATSVVRTVLDMTEKPVEYETVAARLQEAGPSATPEKVDRLLADLCEQTFILTDLRPPLTTGSPARYVRDRLAGIPDAADVHGRLQAMLDACAAWDDADAGAAVTGLRNILERAGSPPDGSKEPPIQVDMALAADGHLGRSIAAEAARAAELLLRLSPSPRGTPAIAAYRNAFVSRYGQEREVPLLEVLDPDRGLGPVAGHGHAYVGADPSRGARRSAALLRWACSALHDRRAVLDLDGTMIEQIETWDSRPDAAPLSLDINVLVGARSPEAIDAGDFIVVVGPNLGAWAAGRNFGRFAHLQPHGERDFLGEAAAAEEAAHLPDHLWVEVVFLPSNVRSANVAIRPAVRQYEVVFGASPGVCGTHVIPLDELIVGVDGGRFYVRWPAARKRLHFVSGHMLNPGGAPAVAQFLLQVSHDAAIAFTSFDWGPAEAFPFLPRVQSGRVVLRPAEWKLSKGAGDARELQAIETWRQEWDVPRHVALSVGDNRLVIDLDCEEQVRQIALELHRLRDGQSLLVQEVVPALDEAWLGGGEGHYYSEVIVPLLRQPAATPAEDRSTTPTHDPALMKHPDGDVSARERATAATAIRRHPPGSSWLFAKLYCPSGNEDRLIAGPLLDFARNAVASELARSWFFIRYADPESHIRLRFNGEAERLTDHLFGHVGRWARELIDQGACTRLAFDTYDQEIERFGGPAGMEASEAIFHADSEAAARLLGVLLAKEWADSGVRTPLVALATDDMLQGLGMDAATRIDWYKRHAGAAGRESGGEYRALKNGLRRALGDPGSWLADRPSGAAVQAALEQRRERLLPIAAQLLDLSAEGRITRNIDSLASSYVHLQLNRLGAAASEHTLLGVLLRTLEGLAKAPAR
jgi:thiopeptide-type bacteriocin biosynthesis protein